MHLELRSLLARHLNWEDWEHLIRANGFTIDRPYSTPHPRHPAIIYPIDYGYVNGTIGSDGEALDVFVGAAEKGLVAAIMTRDRRREDCEVKLLYDCTPEEVYLAHGFVNYDPELMHGVLVMRQPMQKLWGKRRITVNT